jgi:hypothetical protein
MIGTVIGHHDRPLSHESVETQSAPAAGRPAAAAAAAAALNFSDRKLPEGSAQCRARPGPALNHDLSPRVTSTPAVTVPAFRVSAVRV